MGTLLNPLTTIPDGAVDLTFPPLQYENDFASIVGNAATDSDGFDAIFADASTIATEYPNFAAGLDIAIDLFDTALPGVDTPWEQDFSDTVTNAISQGDPDFEQFNVDMTGNSPPPAGGTPGNPAGGSGALPSGPVTYIGYIEVNYSGASGYVPPDIITLECEVDPNAQGQTGYNIGGGTAGLGGTINNTEQGNPQTYPFPKTTAGGAPVSVTVVYQNTYAVNLRLTSLVLGPPGQQVWSADFGSVVGNVLQPGDVRHFTVTFTPPAPVS